MTRNTHNLISLAAHADMKRYLREHSDVKLQNLLPLRSLDTTVQLRCMVANLVSVVPSV